MDYEKLNRRLDHMFTYESDDFFVNINIPKEISDILFDYQVFHLFNLISAFRNNNIILDGSDTGTGKTYTSIALCKQLGLKPFIICPKRIISTWKRVCDIFEVNPLGIVNYESIKNGNFYDINDKVINCRFIEINEEGIRWKLPYSSVVIFDEVHKCKNPNSQNGFLLLSTKNLRKVLMLSATLTDKPTCFKIFGYMLNCYKNLKQSKAWINGRLLEDKVCINPDFSAINKAIYPNRGSRMRIKELGDKFPLNQISVDTYAINNNDKELVNKAFKKINKNQINLESDLDNNNNGQILGEIMKARQLLEQIKVQIMVDLAKDYLDNGYSVVIFVNFVETINKLSRLLNTKCLVYGKISPDDIMDNIKSFQDNKSNIIICNSAMVEGLGLHDLHGVARVSIISPPDSVIRLVQVLGRISRAGAKTPALQRIVYCADTCEEVICNRLKDKLGFLSKLNDNDLIRIDA